MADVVAEAVIASDQKASAPTGTESVPIESVLTESVPIVNVPTEAVQVAVIAKMAEGTVAIVHPNPPSLTC